MNHAHVSVVICTHNPREDYLRRTLDALRVQTLSKGQWELLIIDNASREPLAGIWDLSWHPHARHVREDKLGLTAARLRGIQETVSEILVFVDDDNVLQPDYLHVVLRLAAEHTKLGCFGAGVLEPEFEREPEPELKLFTGGLALRSFGSPSWSNSMEDAIFPLGAGLVVRKVVAEKYIAVVQNCPLRKQLGRSGSNLNAGEDDEFSWVACDLGLGKGVFPELKIRHLISRKRVEKQYLLDLTKGHGFSQTLLKHLHGKPISVPPKSSNLGIIFGNLICGNVSGTLYHADTWWKARHKPKIEKEFYLAWREGMEVAQQKLAELQKG